MPDITMCYGEKTTIRGTQIIKTGTEICPLREKCKRFLLTPNQYRQSYFTQKPEKDSNCNYLMA